MKYRSHTCPTLSENKVVRPEGLAKGARLDGVHGTRLEVDENRPGHVIASLALVEVDLDPVQLLVRVHSLASVTGIEDAIRVNTVLTRNHLPKLEGIVNENVGQIIMIILFSFSSRIDDHSCTLIT